MSRLYKYLEELEIEEEGMTTGSVGGLSASDVTPATNGLRKKPVTKRKKKLPKHKPAILPGVTIQE